MDDIDCHTCGALRMEHDLDVFQYTFQIALQSQNPMGVVGDSAVVMCGVECEVGVGEEIKVKGEKGFPPSLDLMEVGFVDFGNSG